MKVDLRFRGVSDDQGLREHAERRIAFGLRRYAPELRSVVLRVRDVNGPRGGIDQRCHVTVSGPRLGRIEVEELASEARAAVSAAVERIARATARRLERSHPRRDVPSIRGSEAAATLLVASG